ncbi:hypothetical protein BH20ACT18_BH20ACT18_03060 [soil metagenome]
MRGGGPILRTAAARRAGGRRPSRCTPITSLRLLAEAVEDDIVDEVTRRRYLAQMQTHIHALSILILLLPLAALTRVGAGLGLAISRAIVEAHGGRIWLADSTAGTRVRFSLPAAA